MFERYTERARRVVFFARYEASQFGSPYIETEHILLGLLREDPELRHRFLHGKPTEAIRAEIERHTLPGKKLSTSVDLPLSNEGKRVLAYAAEEAERLSDRHIGTEHLFLGLLRESKCFAAQLLADCHVSLDVVRQQLESLEAEAAKRRAEPGPTSLRIGRTELTRLASEDLLPPLIGRQSEMERLIQVLGRAHKRNAVLVGPFGVGRRTIVGGLAQRIVDQQVPEFLRETKIIACDLEQLLRLPMAAQPAGRKTLIDRIEHPEGIYFIDELFTLLLNPPLHDVMDAADLLKAPLLERRLQCITIATPEEAGKAFEKSSWLERCFTVIEIAECSHEEAIEVLNANRVRLEKFHDVTYTSEAIKAAVLYSAVFLKDRFLPDKALDLLDEAGAYRKAQPDTSPEEVVEARKRVRVLAMRMQNAVANHEFEKARFYTDEERRERRALEELEKKHDLGTQHLLVITRETVEEALSKWISVSVEAIRKAAEGS
jgi:ATP-dependent Clp protease ATP-binding subunit ClpC